MWPVSPWFAEKRFQNSPEIDGSRRNVEQDLSFKANKKTPNRSRLADYLLLLYLFRWTCKLKRSVWQTWQFHWRVKFAGFSQLHVAVTKTLNPLGKSACDWNDGDLSAVGWRAPQNSMILVLLHFAMDFENNCNLDRAPSLWVQNCNYYGKKQ